MDWSWLDWAAVAVLGGVVGASELISRYKDNPWGGDKDLAGDLLHCNQLCSVGWRARSDPRERLVRAIPVDADSDGRR